MWVFIDTNILLSFFHFSADDLEELRKLHALLENKQLSLVVPQQVCDEFLRNRSAKINDTMERLGRKEFSVELPQLCKHYEQYKTMREAQSNLEQARAALVKLVKEDAERGSLKADLVVRDLFNVAPSIEATPELLSKAESRVGRGNPPGKKGSLGDAINWETILQVVPDGEDLHIVTDDVDYSSALERTAFDEFLGQEWTLKKRASIKFYRTLSEFFRINHPTIKLAAETKKELAIAQWEESGSYRDTHSNAAELSRFADFTTDQANRILRAASDNGQICGIIGDSDISTLLNRVIVLQGSKLDGALVATIQKLIAECTDDT